MSEVMLGFDNRSIDFKGRIILPKSFKIKEKEKFVSIVRKDFIEVKRYEDVLKELNNIKGKLENVTSVEMFEFYQDRINSITSCVTNVISVDKQGRFLVGSLLKERYKLDNDIVIEGTIDSFRVWHPDKFMEYQEEKMGRKSRI